MKGSSNSRWGFFSLSFLLFFLAAAFSADAQNIYSRKTGNWDDNTALTGTWSLIGHGGLACSCVPGAGNTVLIGANNTVTLRSGLPAAAITVTALTVNDNATTGFLVFGDAATVTTLNVTGDVLINAAGSLQSGATGATVHTLNIGGNLTNNNIFNLTANAATAQVAVFNGNATRTISGTGGTFTFNNLTLSTVGAVDVNVQRSLTVNGVLNFSANGRLVVDAASNITLGSAATVTGTNANRYIQLDESNSTNGQLIRVNDNTVAAWQFFFPVGTATGGYAPLDLTAGGGSLMTTAPANNATLAVKAIVNPSVQGQMRRTFRLTVAGNANATTFSLGDFYYNSVTDVSSGDVLANYITGWYLNNTTGAWTTVTSTAPGAGFFTSPATAQALATGIYYYTIGTSTAYPSTWYTYQSGVWSDPNIWTTDPSGTTLVNPLTQPPLPGDEVVILNGFTVTVDINNITTSTTTVQGGAILDMATFTGHNLGTVDGAGLLRINGVALPAGTYTSFVSVLGGTVEYYNTGGNLPTGQTTYNKLLLTNGTNSAITFVTGSNLTINSTMNITQTAGTGTVTWQINNASNTQRTLSIAGDLTVSASGLITVGTGNSGAATPHNLTLQGNLVNNGTIKFFDPTDANYSVANYTAGNVYTAAAHGNAVTVIFSGTTSNTLTCSGPTDFYRLTLNKGTGQQAILTLNSTAAANFRLFGPANLSSSGTAPDNFSNNALSLLNGTLELTGTLTIPVLCANGAGAAGNDYFAIPENAALWLNSANVTVTVANNLASNDDQRILANGLLRITNGIYNSGFSRGLGSGSGGTFIVEGGTVNVWQYRPLFGGTNIFVYIQTGGTVNVGTTGYNSTPALSGVVDAVTDQYARFSLPTTTSTFQMSGGTLNIGTPSQNTTLAGAQGFDVQSSANNFNVTGGTINAYIPSTGFNFGINSTVPLYNLNVYREGTGAALTATLNQPIAILNNLALITGNTPALVCNDHDLSVGGNITIGANTTLTPGTNTITINGGGAQTWTNSGTISGLNNLVINKAAGTVTLGGANAFPSIVGTGVGLTLTAGTLNDGGKTLTVTNAISNSAIHTGTGSITVNGPTAIGGVNGSFGNLILTTNGTVATNGPQTITGNLQLNGAATTVFDIESNNLTVLGNITTTGTFGTNYRILTSGLHNSNGLTRKATSAVDLLFPVGTAPAATTYTPITINVTATTTGNITVRPVIGAHPVVTAVTQSVQYYWRVTSTGFAGITVVSHRNYTYFNATRDNASTTYRPARYDVSTFSWAYGPTYNATTGAGLTNIPTFNTSTGWTGLASTQLDGEYTAGNQVAFGAVSVYYTSSTPTFWGVNSSWSITSVGHAADAGSIPCATCPVVIGDASNSHTIRINANNQSSGTLQIATTSTLDCGTFTGLSFGANTGGTVLGRGTLRIGSANFPAGDFTNFLGTAGGTVEWYAASSYIIPSIGPAPQNLSLTNYYNLSINPNVSTGITLPANDLTIYNDLTKSGAGTTFTNITADQDLTVQGDVDVTAGIFNLQNGSSYNIVVDGTVTVSNGATFNVPGAGPRTHTMTVTGSIVNNGTFILRNGTHVGTLTFTGTSDESLTGAGTTTTLNTLTVNKGTSQTSTLTVDVTGTVNTLSNNWLILQNGTVNFNNAAYAMVLTNTTGNPYTIGLTSRLKVQGGTVTVSNINSASSDLFLTGALEVAGGTFNVGASGNNANNDIEYASAGLPSITVSGGTLYVNGAIRRSTSVLAGALVYDQSGGTVTLGGRNCNVAPNNTRAIFEIENVSGSSFSMTGGTLTVRRPTGGSSFTDLYLNPETSSVSAASTVQIGDNALGAQTLDINVTPPLGSLTILGAAGNAQTVNMVSSPLSSSGTLTINAGSTLNTNSLNVAVGGDLIINGTYNGTIGSGNTTTFNGAGAQSATLSASSTFFNMTVNKAAGTVTLGGTAPTVTDLNILSGALDVFNLDLVVIGNITNNSSQTNTSGGSLSLAGGAGVTTQLINSTNGSFGKISLAGAAATKNVKVTGNITINNQLVFAANRFLTIGSSQLTFGTAATVTGAGATSFIRTSGVNGDLGVVKNWAVGGATLFVYPVGTLNNYTPVNVTLTVTTAGSLTVSPVNSRHPTANVGSSERVLNYYWIVTRNGTLAYSATGSHIYSYPSALMGGTGGTLTAGYLDISNPTGWITGSAGSSANTTTMTFTNALATNLPSLNNTYHLTVGTTNTLPNPIVPVYSRLDDAGVAAPGTGGNWNAAASWTLSATGHGAALGAAPTGVPVVILSGARINMNVNGRIAFTSQTDGLLVIGTSFGHNLGIMKGTGTMRTSTNVLPAGNYTTFVSAAGGTIEYVAPMTLNNRTTYNNLTFSGAGVATMTASDLTLNGSMTIPAGVTVSNASNRDISVARNWSNAGTFSGGTGTVTFNGTVLQTITGTTAFNNVTVNKSNNLSLSSATTVNGILNLLSGNVISSAFPAASLLVMGLNSSVSGGSATSFVDGRISKTLATGGTFTFPLGSVTVSRYRPVVIANTTSTVSDVWTASYIGKNPTTDGFSNMIFNTANMKRVSQYEYWQVACTSGTSTARMTLSFGTGSYGGADIGILSSLKTVRWTGTTWDLPPGGGTFSQGGTNVTGTVTVSFQNSFSPQTIATDDINSTLPLTWLSFEGKRVGPDVNLRWKTAQEINNDHFEIERSLDGGEFSKIGTLPGAGNSSGVREYAYIDKGSSPNLRYYYRIRQVDNDGRASFSNVVMVLAFGEITARYSAFPNPVTSDDEFQVKLMDTKVDASKPVQITVIASDGRIVFRGAGLLPVVSAAVKKELDSLSTGVYLLQIDDNEMRETFRIVRY